MIWLHCHVVHLYLVYAEDVRKLRDVFIFVFIVEVVFTYSLCARPIMVNSACGAERDSSPKNEKNWSPVTSIILDLTAMRFTPETPKVLCGLKPFIHHLHRGNGE